MFSIKRTDVDNESTKSNAKNEPVTQNNTVFDAVKLTIWNLFDSISALASYNAAHWVLFVDRWKNNLTSMNSTTYKRGEIVFLDLGAQNYRYEPSYTHACIILENRYNSVLIVPCSTKKFGKGQKGIIDATTADGFIRDTGIQTESFRWVSKNRIVSRTGKIVSPRVLDLIDAEMLSMIPTNKKQLATIKQLESDKESLQTQVENLIEEKKKIEEELAELKKKTENPGETDKTC